VRRAPELFLHEIGLKALRTVELMGQQVALFESRLIASPGQQPVVGTRQGGIAVSLHHQVNVAGGFERVHRSLVCRPAQQYQHLSARRARRGQPVGVYRRGGLVAPCRQRLQFLQGQATQVIFDIRSGVPPGLQPGSVRFAGCDARL